MSLTDEDKKEIAAMMGETIQQHKKEKNWFMKLNWFYKLLLAIPAIVLSLTTISSGVNYVLDIVYHEDIMQDNADRKLLYNLVKMDSSIIYSVDRNRKQLDTLRKKGVEGNKFYAVGYRAEKNEDGTIVRHYRDWDGKMYPIFPDPQYSTSAFTYWFYINPDGTKEWTFGK
jgi:hypothetical protein